MSGNKSSLLRVAVLWHDTILAEQTVNPHTTITLGEDLSNTFVIPASSAIGKRYKLISPVSGEPTLHLHPEMKGSIRMGEKERAVSEFIAQGDIPIAEGTSGLLDLGELGIYFTSAGKREKGVGGAFWSNLETAFLAGMLVAIVAHFGFMITAYSLWEDDTVDVVALDLSDRFLKIIAEEPPAPIEEVPLPEELLDEPSSKAAGGDEGKFGEQDRTNESKVPKREGEMVDRVREVGIHRALNSLSGAGALSSVFGNRQGFDSRIGAAMAGADGELVIGHGSGGLGLKGTGTGGGGTGFGQIHGMGSYDGGGTGAGRGAHAKLGGKGKAQRKVTVRKEKGEASGFCKEADIAKVVAARQSGVQACYEKELGRNPELQGRIVVSWRINLEGKVQGVKVEQSTLNNAAVEGCIKRAIERWVFTKPDGGFCQIRYPFVFSAGL